MFTDLNPSMEDVLRLSIVWSSHFTVTRPLIPAPTTHSKQEISAGDWITGFHKLIGITTPLQAELWDIYIGLQLAWIHRFDLLQIHSDSLQAIKLLNEANLDRDLFSLVRVISSLCCRSWYTEFLWVPHEGNMSANGMVKLPIVQNEELLSFPTAPATIVSLLERDILGLSYLKASASY
ncbi:hypothetical protein F3Y22_tig00002237pilonHSYRG01270 [Hibiscus syriacus]|uniref:RNase H type-1 domain-containing protein n=1 Tax=Hibiscus syriacus TaxID=106335 RepID=A0A6A3CY36_HIBSY|nr:hypothetical protein F3Y22_tig00002237pilonHSYRG01270 [Hibiscus syriacus]